MLSVILFLTQYMKWLCVHKPETPNIPTPPPVDLGLLFQSGGGVLRGAM